MTLQKNAVADWKKYHKMQQDPHNIIINQNSYGTSAEFNYWAYMQGNRLLSFRSEYEYIKWCINFAPEFISKEKLTPDIMISLIFWGTSYLKGILKIVPENEIPESVKLYAAQRDTSGVLLSILKNPSDNVINIALQTAGQNLEHLSNPTKQQILLGLLHETDTPWLITKIKKPTVQMQIAAVTHDSYAYKYITNPSESVKLAAVRAHGICMLREIKNPSEQVILTAIRHTLCELKEDFFLYYIPRPSHKIWQAIKTQVKQNNQRYMEYCKAHPELNEPNQPTKRWFDADMGDSKKIAELKQEFRNILCENTFAPR